jgi:hypothetical protein
MNLLEDLDKQLASVQEQIKNYTKTRKSKPVQREVDAYLEGKLLVLFEFEDFLEKTIRMVKLNG